jgi:peptide/nickel transport system ATP-binding protein
LNPCAPRLRPVIAGLDPAIHPFSQDLLAKKMDARVKPAHDEFFYEVKPAGDGFDE